MGKRQRKAAAKLLLFAGMLGLSFLSAQPYAPAFYYPGPPRGNDAKLFVFPLDGASFSVPLPFQMGKFAVTPDGKNLYGMRFFDPAGRNTGLYNIELGAMRVMKVPGSEGFASVYGIAASPEKIVVSAGYLSEAGLLEQCGLYELILTTGDVDKILSNSNCKYASSWSSISISPDSHRLITVRKHHLELIDTDTKAVRSLGEGFYYASWSPNGRWIAALGDGGEHTMIFDAATLEKQKTLSRSEVIWSPDSGFLLASRLHTRCAPDFGTLHLIDIETGKASMIESSACKISQLVFGWVNLRKP